MVRLSSSDASKLIDLMEETDLSDNERLSLLDGSDNEVIEIGHALLTGETSQKPDIREAVEQIKLWADETRQIEEKIEEKRQYA